MIKNIIFDWGDTVMRDYPEMPGAMCDWSHVELIPHVYQALADLKPKYTLAIATTAGVSDTDAMIRALQRVAVKEMFGKFYSSKELGVAKPDPMFFTEVCRRAELQPNCTVMVGNDYEKDIVGAKTAGLKTVFFNEKHRQGDFPAADIIIFSMDSLCMAIDEIMQISE
jgi:FMN phosphatase YigB (HAD superfamily)